MRDRGLKNPAVGRVVDRHPGTVSKWRNGAQLPSDAEVEMLEKFLEVEPGYLKYGKVRYAPEESKAQAVRDSRQIPADYPTPVRALIREFEVEATNEGATEWEIDFCRSVLTSPEARVMYQGGVQRDIPNERLHREVSALIAALRVWLKGRQRIRRGGA